MPAPDTGAPVYLLTVDSLRADRFDADRFPACWERFSSDFLRFSTAYANGVATPLAFPSILADDRVSGNGVVDPAATTLAELVPGTGVGVPNNVHLSRERGYHRGFSTFDVDPGVGGYLRRALTLPSVRADARRHLRRELPAVADPEVGVLYRPAGRMAYELKTAVGDHDPAFLWGHFMDPHGPYHPDLVFDREVPVSFEPEGFEAVNERWRSNGDLSEEDLGKLLGVYEEKIRYLDRQLDELLGWLEAEGRYGEALIVVTADHGQFVGEGGQFGHTWTNLPEDELLRVPLLVKFPDGTGAGQVRDYPVQHLDLAATVADHVDADADLNPDSVRLTDGTDRYIIAKSNAGIRGISADSDVLRTEEGLTGTEGADPELVERVRSAAPAKVTNNVGQGELTEEERERVDERLAELGYR